MEEKQILEFGTKIINEAADSRKSLANLRALGMYSEEYIRKEAEHCANDLKEKVQKWFKNSQTDILNEMSKIESQYRKPSEADPSAELLAFNRTQARIRAMSDAGLEARAREYIANGDMSVDEFDLLLGELQTRGMSDLAQDVRLTESQQHHTYAPWKRDGKYQQIERDLNLVRAYAADPDTIYYQGAKGPECAKLSELVR
jgi:hypothetical protein